MTTELEKMLQEVGFIESCPFCGFEAVEIKSEDGYDFVSCPHCQCRGPAATSETLAWALWDRSKS